jgi:K+-sensing histidine kinase KdpD
VTSPVKSVAGLITSDLHVRADAPIATVVQMWESHVGTDGMAVLGSPHIRFVSRMRFFYQLGKRFGYSLFEHRPISMLADDASVVEADMDPVEVIALATQREPERIYDDLVVVEAGRFLGLVSVRSLLVHHKDLIATGVAERAILEERNRLLQEAERARTEFTTALTRDLRGPASSMLGVARGLLADAETRERHGAALEALLARAQAVLGVVDDLQDLARLEHDELTPVAEALELGAFLKEAASSAQPRAGSTVPIRTALAAFSAPFVSDPVILGRIVSNLACALAERPDTAVTMTAESDRGDLCLGFAAEAGLDAADWEALRVQVTGRRDKRSPLAKPTRRSLRLLAVKGLVERLGGRVETSIAGHESRIALRIPSLAR